MLQRIRKKKMRPSKVQDQTPEIPLPIQVNEPEISDPAPSLPAPSTAALSAPPDSLEYDSLGPIPRGPAPKAAVRRLRRRAKRQLSDYFAATSNRERAWALLVALMRHHSVRTANAMAFDLFLAMIPMLGLTGWLLSLFLSEEPQALSSSSMLLNLTPEELRVFLGRHFHALSAVKLAPIAVVVGWWLSSSAFYTLICVFEESFDCKPRAWYQSRLISLGLALMGALLVAGSGSIGMLLTLEELGIIAELISSDLGRNLVQLALLLGTVLGLAGFVALMYRFSIRRGVQKRRVWPGALLATSLGSLATVGLGYYAANIASYSLFYGGLATVVVAMLWLWLWCTAILLGAEINVALEDIDPRNDLVVTSR